MSESTPNSADLAFNPGLRRDPELIQAQADFDAYLDTRPTEFMVDRDGHFDSVRRHHEETTLAATSYADMGLMQLAEKMAEAELDGDKTVADDVLDVILEKIDAHVDKAKQSHGANNTGEDLHATWLDKIEAYKDDRKHDILMSRGDTEGAKKQAIKEGKFENYFEAEQEANTANTTEKPEETIATPTIIEVAETESKAEPVVVEVGKPSELPKRKPKTPTVVEVKSDDDSDIAPVVSIALGPAVTESEPEPGASDLTVDELNAIIEENEGKPKPTSRDITLDEIQEAVAEGELKKTPSSDSEESSVVPDVIPEGSFDDTSDDEGSIISFEPATPLPIRTREDLGMDVDPNPAPSPTRKQPQAIPAPSQPVKPQPEAEVVTEADPRIDEIQETEALKKIRQQLEQSRDELAQVMLGRKGKVSVTRKFSEKRLARAMAKHDMYLDRFVAEGTAILQTAGFEGEELTGLINLFKAQEVHKVTEKEMELTYKAADRNMKNFLQQWADDNLTIGAQRKFFAKNGGLFAVLAGVSAEVITAPNILDQIDSPKTTVAAVVIGMLAGVNKSANQVAAGVQTVEADYKNLNKERKIEYVRRVREDRVKEMTDREIDRRASEAQANSRIIDNSEINSALRSKVNSQREVGRAEARKPFRRSARKTARSKK